MAIKVQQNLSRPDWGNIVAQIGSQLAMAGATGATGFEVYKHVDEQSIGPVLRIYTTAINAMGLSGAGHVPVYKHIDQQRIPTVIRQCCVATNLITGGATGAAFPGQSGNPVGFAAAPGYPGSLTPWPGGTGNQTIGDGTHATSGSGTLGDPWVFQFFDFDGLTGGTVISGSNMKFIGCRFQSNDVAFYNISTSGANLGFSYCSVVPRVSLVGTVPPNAAWPSASAGQQVINSSPSYASYCIGGNNGYQMGFFIGSGGPVTIDHCDMWGGGNAGVYWLSTTAQVNVTDCWIHDTPNEQPQAYHVDGLGYFNGGVAPSNILVQHCTIASIGNTNGVAFQTATSAYDNIKVIKNFISGWGYAVNMCHNISGNANLQFTDNVLATDLAWVFGPIYADFSAQFTSSTNLWRRNTLSVLPGTSPIAGSNFSFTSADNGKFILPNQTLSTADWSL